MQGIIVDDDSTIQLLLKEYCSIHPEFEIIKIFNNAVEALKYLQNENVDFMFLDIHMPYITGIELLESLKNPPKIIMVTSDPNFAIDAFQHAAIIDYLLKPLSYSRFLLTLEKLKSLKKENNTSAKATEKNSLFVSSNGKMIKILFKEITYIQANGDYVDIYTLNKRHIIHSTFKKIKVKLPGSIFFQVHRSYIVNIDRFSEIEDNCIIIERKVIPISKTYRTGLYQKLNML